jgi:hypothetical protein
MFDPPDDSVINLDQERLRRCGLPPDPDRGIRELGRQFELLRTTVEHAFQALLLQRLPDAPQWPSLDPARQAAELVTHEDPEVGRLARSIADEVDAAEQARYSYEHTREVASGLQIGADGVFGRSVEGWVDWFCAEIADLERQALERYETIECKLDELAARIQNIERALEEPDSFWEQYKLYIIASAIVVGALGGAWLLISALERQRQREWLAAWAQWRREVEGARWAAAWEQARLEGIVRDAVPYIGANVHAAVREDMPALVESSVARALPASLEVEVREQLPDVAQPMLAGFVPPALDAYARSNPDAFTFVQQTNVYPTTRVAVPGPPGPKGDKGDKGDRGDRGAHGMRGRPGRAGRHGRDGRRGRDGRHGRDGVTKVVYVADNNTPAAPTPAPTSIEVTLEAPKARRRRTAKRRRRS